MGLDSYLSKNMAFFGSETRGEQVQKKLVLMGKRIRECSAATNDLLRVHWCIMLRLPYNNPHKNTGDKLHPLIFCLLTNFSLYFARLKHHWACKLLRTWNMVLAIRHSGSI